MKKLLLLLLLCFSTGHFSLAQHVPKPRKVLLVPDIQLSSRISLLNNTIKDAENKKVAWSLPSFVLPQFMLSLNVYNTLSHVDFGVRLPIEKSIFNFYKDSTEKKQIIINRYWQFRPGFYLKYKIGDHLDKNRNRYWILYSEINYCYNFGFKKKEMNYNYKSFDPLNDEYNVFNGIANVYHRSIIGSRAFNKSKDVIINKENGISTSFGIGKEYSCYESGVAWVVVVTKNHFNTFNKNYVNNGVKSFEGWKERTWFAEFKLIYRLNFKNHLEDQIADYF